MSKEKSHDLKISGSMTLPGGNFKNVYISGELEINGDTVVDGEYKVSGSGKVNGNISMSSSSISGKVDIEGNLDSGDISIWGHLAVGGNMSAKNLSVKGRADVGGTVSAETINAHGELMISKDCNAEEFLSKGIVRIDGMLNAGIIELKLIYSTSRIMEIGGESIKVTKSAESRFLNTVKSLFVPADIIGGKLHADIIEGDEVQIEYTKAKMVMGNNVTIGPECEIETVEYKTALTVDDKSLVKQVIKL